MHCKDANHQPHCDSNSRLAETFHISIIGRLGDISISGVHITARSNLITPGPYNPMAETEGARALLERRCSGVRVVGDQSIALESFGQVYELCISLKLIHLELSQFSAIIYARR